MDTILLQKRQNLNMFSFQTTAVLKNDLNFLNSVNILFNNKIIKKIYMQKPLKKYDMEDAKNIAENYILKNLNLKAKVKNKNQHKYTKKAYNNAGTNLFSNLNI